MSSSYIPPTLESLAQSSVFYTETWTQAVDKRFIEMLRAEKERGQFDPNRRNTVTIRRVMRSLNAELNTSFDFDFCSDRVKKLQKRYKTFYFITKYRGVTFDLESNKIECDQALWSEICKSRRLAMAYATQGEAEYENLRYLFKQEDDSVGWYRLEDIVQISSEFFDLSFPNHEVYPHEMYDASSGSSFWRYVVGNSFGSSSLGLSGTNLPSTSSVSNVAVCGSEINSATSTIANAVDDAGNMGSMGAATDEHEDDEQ